MYDLMGLTKEQLQESIKQAQEKVATYTEDSIDQARAKWHDAREMLQSLQLSTNYELRAAAVQCEAEAKKNLDDALQHAGPLAQQKREREALAAKNAEMEAEQRKTQQEHAATEKAAFRIEARAKWLAAGGSEHSFGENFESLWTQEVVKRVQLSPSEQELVRQKLAQSGRYQA